MLSETRRRHAFHATDAIELLALELGEFVTAGLFGWRTGKRAGMFAGVAQDAVGRGSDETLVGAVRECVEEHVDREGCATQRGHGGTLTLDALPSGDDGLGGVVLDDVGELVD